MGQEPVEEGDEGETIIVTLAIPRRLIAAVQAADLKHLHAQMVEIKKKRGPAHEHIDYEDDCGCDAARFALANHVLAEMLIETMVVDV